MSHLLFLFATGFVVTVAAALVPGPDVLLVLRCSLVRGRSAGLQTILGIGCGLLIYSLTALVAASTIGLAPPLVFGVVRLVGACYLAYLGFGLLHANAPMDDINSIKEPAHSCLMQGCLTNVSNPKVLLFYLCLLTQLDTVHVGLLHRIALLAGAVVGPISSFLLIVCVSSSLQCRLRPSLIRWIDRISGLLMLGFAALALAASCANLLAASG
jgi:threonine/homoserine/homoserine lactone efflux protein